MHRSSLHTVARRRIYPSNRTFSSSSLLSNEPGQSGEPGSKPQLKATPRVPRASSLGGIDLSQLSLSPVSAPSKTVRPSLTQWVSDDNTGATLSFAQRQASRRVDQLRIDDSEPSWVASSPPQSAWPAQPHKSNPPRAAQQSGKPAQGGNGSRNQVSRGSGNQAGRGPGNHSVKGPVDHAGRQGTQAGRAQRQPGTGSDIQAEARRKERVQANAERKLKAEEEGARETEYKSKISAEIQTRKEEKKREKERLMLERGPPPERKPAKLDLDVDSMLAATQVNPSEVVEAELQSLRETTADSADKESLLIAARIQWLKERAGDYSRFLPAGLGVQPPAPGQLLRAEKARLGPAAYAQLTLTRRKGAGLRKREEVVKVVERYVKMSKGVRESAQV